MSRKEDHGLAFDDTKALATLRELSRDGDCRADLRLVVHGLMRAFGGPTGFAHQVKLDFDANQPGSANRIKIETQIISLLQNFEPEDEEFGEEDMEAMDKRDRETDDKS